MRAFSNPPRMGPLTLYAMTWQFEEYRRCRKLARHNRDIAAAQKAAYLAKCFPAFPETYQLTERR